MPTVILYPHRNFTGTPFVLTKNAKSLPDWIYKGSTSLRVIKDADPKKKWPVHFWNSSEYGGPELIVAQGIALPDLRLIPRNKSIFCFRKGDWNHRIASVYVREYGRINMCATIVDKQPKLLQSAAALKKAIAEEPVEDRTAFKREADRWQKAVIYMTKAEMKTALADATRIKER